MGRVLPALLAFGAALLAGLILFAPMRWAVALSGAPVSAERVEGTIWEGRLTRAVVGGVAVGDAGAGLDPTSLLGAPRLRVRAETVEAKFGADGVRNLVGTLKLPNGVGFAFDRVEAVFRDGRCLRASGRIAVDLATPLGPARVVGAPRCEGPDAVARLTGAAGPLPLTADLTLRADGGWAAAVTAEAGDPAVVAALAGAGFAPEGGRAVLRRAGRL